VGKANLIIYLVDPWILWRQGYEVLKSIGFSGSEVCDILKGHHPTVLSCTESTVWQKFDFLVNNFELTCQGGLEVHIICHILFGREDQATTSGIFMACFSRTVAPKEICPPGNHQWV
jgi:hypothetical protein